MHQYNERKESEMTEMQTRLEHLRQDYAPYEGQEDLNLMLDVFPQIGERLRVAKLCKSVGLTVENIKRLFKGETLTVTGKLYSPEHEREFNVHEAKLEMPKERDKPVKFRLLLNGQDILGWFTQKFSQLQERTTIKLPEKKQGRGIS